MRRILMSSFAKMLIFEVKANGLKEHNLRKMIKFSDLAT
jgi:hypothetical protein